MLPDLATATAGDLLAGLRDGRWSSRDLLEATLERVGSRADLNAVVTLDPEGARASADARDAERTAGGPLGPLHGLPMTVKDCFETAGLRTTAGVPALSQHVPERDAIAVARLRAAGAVVYGKTNTPPWASDWQTTNPIFGRTNNPHDPGRSPGGSSGGSAAAVAAGLSTLELGSDIGGSIRVPAHWSGVAGHKPSHGLVPQRGHLPPPPGALAEGDLNVCGPLARSAADLRRALDVLVGPPPEAAVAWRLALPASRGEKLADFRVGAWLDDPACPVDDEMRGVIETALARLRAAGARIDDARPRVDFEEAVTLYQTLLAPLNTRFQSEADWQTLLAAIEGLEGPAAEEGAPDDAARPWTHFLRAHGVRHRDWLVADERRQAIRAAWADFFRERDVLVCPVTLVPAIPHDDRPMPARRVTVSGRERPYVELIGWPGLVTMALLPSTVIPVGRTAAGLPVGVQLVAPHLEDASGLAFAAAAEAVLGGFTPPDETPAAGAFAAVSGTG